MRSKKAIHCAMPLFQCLMAPRYHTEHVYQKHPEIYKPVVRIERRDDAAANLRPDAMTQHFFCVRGFFLVS